MKSDMGKLMSHSTCVQMGAHQRPGPVSHSVQEDERNSCSRTAFAPRSLWLAGDLLDLPHEAALPFLLTPLSLEQHLQLDDYLQTVLAWALAVVTLASTLCILSLTLTPSESCPCPPFIL